MWTFEIVIIFSVCQHGGVGRFGCFFFFLTIQHLFGGIRAWGWAQLGWVKQSEPCDVVTTVEPRSAWESLPPWQERLTVVARQRPSLQPTHPLIHSPAFINYANG